MPLEEKVRSYAPQGEHEYSLKTPVTRFNTTFYTYSDNPNPVTRFPVEKVNDATLPRGNGWVVLGMFNTITKRAQANYAQHPAQFAFTRTHEAAHAINDYEGKNNSEIATDMRAIALGAPPFSRTADEYRQAG